MNRSKRKILTKTNRIKSILDGGETISKSQYIRICGKNTYSVTKMLLKESYPIMRTFINDEIHYYKWWEILK